MPKGINDQSEMKEGAVLNGIMYRRIFREKKHHVQVTCGPPGSGKSYANLRQLELWYRDILKKPFPVENICFSPEQVMGRLDYYSNHPTELSAGEALLYEEGGVGTGNLDFQTSVAKIFNYILQSFRTMRMVLLINLPYFAMLNKQTRQLAQFLLESIGIDKKNNVAMFKPFYLQTNQQTGEIFRHYPEVTIKGYYEKCEAVGYKMPSEEIKIPYEEKKKQFLKGLISGGLISMQNKDKKRLTPFQMQIWGLLQQGITNQTEIAKMIGSTQQKVNANVLYMRAKGYLMEQTYVNTVKNAPAKVNSQQQQKFIDFNKKKRLKDGL